MEEHQGIAKSLTMAMINIAAILGTDLTLLPKEDLPTIIWVIFVLNIVIMFTVCPFIKNIIGSPEHLARKVTS